VTVRSLDGDWHDAQTGWLVLPCWSTSTLPAATAARPGGSRLGPTSAC